MTVSGEEDVSTFGANHFNQGSLPGQIAAELHAAILSGGFPGGTQLKINDLAKRYDTSTMPIREALRQLSALGLVELIPHRGAHVLELSLDDMRDTMDVRLLLEPAAVGRAARKKLSHEDIASATQALGEMEKRILSNDPQSSRRAHEEFHFVFYRAAGSPWLIRLIEMAWQNADRYRFAYPLAIDEQCLSDDEHREILAACIRGDSQTAQEIMAQHIVRSMTRIESLLLHAQTENPQTSPTGPEISASLTAGSVPAPPK